MRTFVHGDGRLPSDLAADLGLYRHRVFVEQLGWKLPSASEGFERDQYDRDDTVYVFARDDDGEIWRLRPAAADDPPVSAEGTVPDAGRARHAVAAIRRRLGIVALRRERRGSGRGGNPAWAVRPMLAAVVECAARLGAKQLIGVTFLSMERLFRRIGVHAHRAGPAQQIDGRMVVACWIDLDAQTLAALDLDPLLCAPPAEAA